MTIPYIREVIFEWSTFWNFFYIVLLLKLLAVTMSPSTDTNLFLLTLLSGKTEVPKYAPESWIASLGAVRLGRVFCRKQTTVSAESDSEGRNQREMWKWKHLPMSPVIKADKFSRGRICMELILSPEKS